FAAIEPSTTAVVLADGKRILARGRGTVVLHTVGQDGNVPGELVLFDVLLIPELRYNLISVFKLNQDHLRVHFDEHFEATITDPFQRSFKVCAIWSWQSQAYVITVMTGTDVSAFFVLDDDEERSGAPDNEELAPPLAGDRLDRFVTMWRLWHERLGHAGSSTLPVLAQNSVGLPEPLWLRRADQSTICRCETCSLTNIKRTPFPTSTTKTTRALELVHGDLTGRVIVKSLGGAEYLAVLVDDYTRMVWVIPLARKSDFVAKFIAWRDEVVPFKGPIGCLRTDGGGEFNNAAIKAALLGARHEKSCAYTSQQNGVAERYVGLIKNVMRPLLHGRNIPLEYWAEAASTAAYIRNRCPSSALDGKTPYELWHGTQPQLGNLRVFGCLAFAMLSDRERAHSLAARGRVGVFIGYDNYHKGYRIHFPDTGEVKVTKFVDFHEHKGYDFSTLDSPSSHADQPPAPHSAARRPRIVVIGPRPPAPSPHPPATVELLDDGDEPIPAPPPPPAAPVGVAPEPAASEAPLPAPVAPARAEIPPPAAPQQQQPQPPARSNARARPQPTISYQTRLHVRRLQDGREQRQANMAVLSMHDSFASAFRALLSADGIELEPNTLKDAMRRTDWGLWLEAMKEEIASHTEMGTWVLEELPADRDLVGSRWVFKLKLDTDGCVARYKARLVAQGFSQVPGVDFHETYSPVTRFVTIRTLLALAAYLGWHVHQLDVVTAYLYGFLKDTVYMRQPPAFEVPGQEHLACRLIRAIYGLKQSGREWFFTLRSALLALGFQQSIADQAIFIYGSGTEAIVVAVYVDDVLVFGKDEKEIVGFKAELAKRFRMKDQGTIGQFLGMKIERSVDGRSFLISQASYIRATLDRLGYKDLNPAPTPLDPKQRLVPYDGQSTEAQQKLFQAELGYLNWLAQASRPDLMHFVAYLSRHAKNPGPIHIACMKRAFRYLAGTIDMKLRIAAHSQDDVVAYSDSDFGGDHSAKSTSGWCVSVYGATVAWGSKLQTLVADSTAQAELIAVWQTSREVMAIRRFFEDLGFRVDGEGQPSVIYCDNQPAIHIISNPVSNGLTRHMERKYLSTREQQERGFINIKYINTRDNPSDMFTKSLPPITFHQHRNTIGIIHHPSTST
ncbi:hypothetical protein CF336_g8454, partial [Tilletia laevis]